MLKNQFHVGDKLFPNMSRFRGNQNAYREFLRRAGKNPQAVAHEFIVSEVLGLTIYDRQNLTIYPKISSPHIRIEGSDEVFEESEFILAP